MINAGCGPRLLEEAGPIGFGSGDRRRKEFERHVPVEGQTLGLVHDPHSPMSEHREDTIMADGFADYDTTFLSLL